ncbi:hypothetical protein WJX73_006308 [Symbiochloris irregularis]|uniref:Uncharacterized protein n=1 Tax=Symbiochloris irregularis TaxID=706552 RepID=A0AAW1NPE6_9CHLO
MLSSAGRHCQRLYQTIATRHQLSCRRRRYLYDAHGSALYDKIVDLQEYYPYRTEINMLKNESPSIIEHIVPGSVIVELGCGSATKTGLILNALLERDGPEGCFFEGIDCSAEFLHSARRNLLDTCPGLLQGNLGTICALYLDGLKEARRRHPGKVLCVLWLGSSVGNLDSEQTMSFFRSVLSIGGSDTQLFVCADLWKDAGMLHAAYCDSQGVTEQFIKNGLANAMDVLGVHMPVLAGGWQYDVVVNADLQQVEMWVVAPCNFYVPGTDISIVQGERVLMEVSRKFTQTRLRGLAFQAGWCWQASWTDGKYSMQMLNSPRLAFESCWADTDALFASMPDWASHPITIRHPFCFYYGHVAAFAKLKVLPMDDVDTWDEMFSRGIDPDVLDTSKCHKHPDAPAQWPTKAEILEYSSQVRQQLRTALRAGRYDMRALHLALEHERMHQETLAGAASGFAWDNEGPRQAPQKVEAFAAAAVPVTVAQFRSFILQENGYDRPELWDPTDFNHFRKSGQRHPATWTMAGSEVWVHTNEATLHWTEVADQHVWVSQAEALAYCRAHDARMMTEPEYTRLLDENAASDERWEGLRTGGWEWTATPFAGLQGFTPMHDYPEYSTDFFDGRHIVLKGSAPSTHSSMKRDSFRNYYQTQYPYMFAKFRELLANFE